MHDFHFREKALRIIEDTRARPSTFASCREAYISRVTSILEMALDGFQPYNFYVLHVPKRGVAYLTLKDPVDQAWADLVAESAVKLLGSSV
jgi:hypothetical protein